MSQPQELGTGGRRPRRARGSLSADEILRGAFEFVETESVDALSMPRLGQHLGVGVTSIYWYYKSKEELLDAMTSAALAQFYDLLPEFPDLDWDEHLRAFFREFRRIFRENSVLCDLVIMRNGNFTAESVRSTYDRIEGIIRALIDAGFTSEVATKTYFALSVYARGGLMIERMAVTMTQRPDQVTMQGMLQQDVTNQERYPNLLEQSRSSPLTMIENDDFEFGLDIAIEGLRARLTDPVPGSTRKGPAASAAEKNAARRPAVKAAATKAMGKAPAKRAAGRSPKGA